MAASPQWNVALLETDKPQFDAWLAACRDYGAATSMADAIRLAVKLAIRIERLGTRLTALENGDKT